jgi:hypothetical protein
MQNNRLLAVELMNYLIHELPHTFQLQAKNPNQLTADYVASGWEPGWENNDATFEMTIVKYSPYHGEYQLANGWGPQKARAIFKVGHLIQSILKSVASITISSPPPPTCTLPANI